MLQDFQCWLSMLSYSHVTSAYQLSVSLLRPSHSPTFTRFPVLICAIHSTPSRRTSPCHLLSSSDSCYSCPVHRLTKPHAYHCLPEPDHKGSRTGRLGMTIGGEEKGARYTAMGWSSFNIRFYLDTPHMRCVRSSAFLED